MEARPLWAIFNGRPSALAYEAFVGKQWPKAKIIQMASMNFM